MREDNCNPTVHSQNERLLLRKLLILELINKLQTNDSTILNSYIYVIKPNAAYSIISQNPPTNHSRKIQKMSRMNSEKKLGAGRVVAVAIENNKTSQHAAKWAVDNLLPKDQCLLLIHVRPKSSSGCSISHSNLYIMLSS